MRRQGYGDGIGMQCFQEAVAYFRLRNQREEQRQMHITNGNIPAKIRAGSKLKKAPTPNMTKVKVVSVLEAQQMPKASHTYDTLRHKNAKRMNEIASMPCHEIFPAIEKWRQERPTSESNDASLVPPRPPAGRADEAEAEFQPVLSRRKVKAAKREANLAAKRKLDAAHWNAPILTAPPVRGVEGVYLANNSADAEALVAGGLFDGYTFAGKLAVLFLGTPSDSLLSSAQQHHINPVPCSIPVMKGVGTYVETGFVWQIGAQEVKSLIVPLEVNWSTTQQPTIVAVDAVNVSVYGAKLNTLFKGDTFTATFRASDALVAKLRECSGVDGVAFRRTSFGNTAQYDKEEVEESKAPFPHSVPLDTALEQLKQLQGHKGLYFKRDGHSLIARVPKSLEDAAWKLIASRTVPGKSMYEIDQLPRSLAAEDLVSLLQKEVHWDTEVVRVKTCGTKQSPWKKALVRATTEPAHTFLQIQGRISTIRPYAKDGPKPTSAASEVPTPASTAMDTSSPPEPLGVESLQKAIVSSVTQALTAQVTTMVGQVQDSLMKKYEQDQASIHATMQQQIEQLTLDTLQRKAARTQG
ncbi:unnamed protein product [Symbiodinium natans]|uniref:Uncharacterized protein n=1 Tax=Symbiodinium natans TaxID=878477 RepID=A0A812VBI6_9DINO|nr:unnamed protein product [Symbiodinium natans]